MMNTTLPIYFPYTPRAVVRRERAVERFRYERPGPPVHHPLAEDELKSCAQVLMDSCLGEQAQSALVCDDGTCGPLAWVLSDAGCDTYVLDPRLRVIYHDLTVAQAMTARDNGATIEDYLFEDLPVFDVFLLGCASFAAAGYVYSPASDLKWAYRVAKRAQRIDRTATMLVAPPRQITRKYRKDAIARTKFRLGPDGIHAFEWWRKRLAEAGCQGPQMSTHNRTLLHAINRRDLALDDAGRLTTA